MKSSRFVQVCRFLLFGLLAYSLISGVLRAQTVQPPFSGSYTATNIGTVPGVPPRLGGLTFLNNNTILIGGAANGASGRLYTIAVARGAGSHITGFSGSATQFGTGIGAYNDGGVVFHSSGVLFTSRWPINELGQTKPGSLNEDKIISLAPLGVASSNSAINFVPGGFGGAGRAKLVSYAGGQWYTAMLSADGTGTFNLTGVTQVDVDPITPGVQNLPGGPEGFVYIPSGNPQFTVNSLLLSEYSAGNVVAYDLDGNGDPLLPTRRVFISGLTGAEGATIDPVTGDFLFSTFGGGDRVIVVQGFIAPPTPTPTPPSAPTPTPTPPSAPTATPTPLPGPGVVVPTLAPGMLVFLGIALAAVALLLLRKVV